MLKNINTKFHENPFTGAELSHAYGRTDRRTDRHDEADSCFSHIYEGTLKKTESDNTWIKQFYRVETLDSTSAAVMYTRT